VYTVLFAYTVGLAAFWPRAFIVIDESSYVTQALAFAHGGLTIPGADPLYPPKPLKTASNHPPGTSLLQTPFVAIAGWRGGALVSLLSLIVATLVTAKWLRENQYNPRFSILIPGFVGALVFGRVAMSDMPSAALIALSLWLLWRAENGAGAISFLAGLVAGINALFREPNLVLLAPFFAGAFARRKGHRWAIILGGAAGIAVRLVLSREMFGSGFYVRDSGYGFSVGSILRNLPVYGLLLLVMFPFGALFPLFYRGPRRAEVLTAFGLYVGLFLAYDFDSLRENGLAKGLLLTSRFVVPMLPVMALMAADVLPRWLARSPSRVQTIIMRALPLAIAGIVIMAFAIHPALARQDKDAASIVREIQAYTAGTTPAITNHLATLKYLSPAYGARRIVLRSYIQPSDVPRFTHKFGKLDLVFLDRTDSEMFRSDAAANTAFITATRSLCSVDSAFAATHTTGKLRVFHVSKC
jgi:4-amino-4-deoxy-L-arabinose transferase-like glycosyltransferase